MPQINILEKLERETSLSLDLPEEVVAKIIRFKWKSMHEATDQFRTVEDSGLGKYTIRARKACIRIEKINIIIDNCLKGLSKEDITERARNKYNSIIKRSKEEKDYLESKI